MTIVIIYQKTMFNNILIGILLLTLKSKMNTRYQIIELIIMCFYFGFELLIKNICIKSFHVLWGGGYKKRKPIRVLEYWRNVCSFEYPGISSKYNLSMTYFITTLFLSCHCLGLVYIHIQITLHYVQNSVDCRW